jgi:hypothetical protein
VIADHEETAAVPEAALLTRLLRGRVQGKHALFFTSDEGIELPDGTEQMTGYAIDEQGDIHAFTLGWDAAQGAPALTRWRRSEPERFWDGVEEYRAARRRVGLSAPAPHRSAARAATSR